MTLSSNNVQIKPILHRDLKPQNVFMGANHDVKLGDFGVAYDESAERLTVPGEWKGKLGYMSPEQTIA